MQLGQLQQNLDAFRSSNAKVFAIDPHDSWSAKHLLKEAGSSTDDLSIPLLMDPSLVTSAEYGVAFQMRIHTERSNRPATFIVGRDGILKYAKRAETFSDRPRPREIIEQLQQTSDRP